MRDPLLVSCSLLLLRITDDSRIGIVGTWDSSILLSQIVRGQGFVGRIVNESFGLIWWVLQPNHLQSVWFDRKITFLMAGGHNLANHDLRETFKQGE
jgi:hypothetical protein